jgi:hypothetical protein
MREKIDDMPSLLKQDVTAIGVEPMTDDGQQPVVVTSSELVSEDDTGSHD